MTHSPSDPSNPCPSQSAAPAFGVHTSREAAGSAEDGGASGATPLRLTSPPQHIATGKILTPEEARTLREEWRAAGRRLVQCHGCFDIVHPGHVRHLEFAATQGDVLLVSISGDAHINKGAARPLIPQQLRAENLAALRCVDHVVIDEHPTAVELLEVLRPDIYIKGREYENNRDPRFLAEREAVERHGGRVMFSSGDVVFSSSSLIHRLVDDRHPFSRQVVQLGQAHDLRPSGLTRLVEQFKECRVVVVGEAVLDSYVFCDRPTLSEEAPTLTLRPGHSETFDGGAAHVARQLAALGAEVEFVTALPDGDADPQAVPLLARLEACGVQVRALRCVEPVTEFRHYFTGRQEAVRIDHGRPITLDESQREAFLHMVRDAVHGRPLGGAGGLPEHEVIVHANLAAAVMHDGQAPRWAGAGGDAGGNDHRRAGGDRGRAGERRAALSGHEHLLLSGRPRERSRGRQQAVADAVILCDFGRGLMTPAMFGRLIRRIRADAPLLTACISGRGSNFHHLRSIDLMCVSENELREATGNLGEGLGAVVWQWFEANAVQSALVTLKEEGVIAFSRLPGAATPKSEWTTRLKSAHLPALDALPLDPSGSRSTLLAVSTLARAAGGDLVQSACLGMIATGIAGRRFGYLDVTPSQMAAEWESFGAERLRLATTAVG